MDLRWFKMIRTNLFQFWLFVQFLILLHSFGSWSLINLLHASLRFSQDIKKAWIVSKLRDVERCWECESPWQDLTSLSTSSTSHIRGGRHHPDPTQLHGDITLAPENPEELPELCTNLLRGIGWIGCGGGRMCSLGVGENCCQLMSSCVHRNTYPSTVSHQLHLQNRFFGSDELVGSEPEHLQGILSGQSHRFFLIWKGNLWLPQPRLGFNIGLYWFGICQWAIFWISAKLHGFCSVLHFFLMIFASAFRMSGTASPGLRAGARLA